MLNIDLRKIYNFYPVEPAPDPAALPTGGDLYYECMDCLVIVNSVPHIKAACACGKWLTMATRALPASSPCRSNRAITSRWCRSV